VTVAAGDLIGATPLLSAAFHDEPSIETMNMLGLDITSVGNHEFDQGWRELVRMQKGGCKADGENGEPGDDNPYKDSCPDGSFAGADFDYLSANVIRKKSGKTLFPGYTVKRVGKANGKPVKMAFIGMTLEDTPNIVTAAGVKGLEFIDEVQAVKNVLPEIRKQGIKSIAVLLHEGGAPANNYEFDGCANVQGPGRVIAEELPSAVDVVISGHTHQGYNCTVEDPKGKARLFTSAFSTGRLVTDLSLQIDRANGDVIRPAFADEPTAAYSAKNHIVTNGQGTKPRAGILDLIAKYKDLVSTIENKVLGQIAPAESNNSVSRTADPDGSGDSPLGNLIADAQLADDSTVTNGQVPTIAFMNPGGIRADLVENDENNVTYGAAFAVQPFNNYLVSVSLTGEQIVDLLEEQWNEVNDGARSRWKILQVAGIRYTWDEALAAQPNTDAVVPGSVLVDGDGDGDVDDPIVPGTTYRVVTNNFLVDGGDGFGTFTDGTDRFFGGLDIDAFSDYLGANNPYTPEPTDRITVIPAPPAG
jgi:5'-nucleotidase